MHCDRPAIALRSVGNAAIAYSIGTAIGTVIAGDRPSIGRRQSPHTPKSDRSPLARASHPASDGRCAGAPLASKPSRYNRISKKVLDRPGETSWPHKEKNQKQASRPHCALPTTTPHPLLPTMNQPVPVPNTNEQVPAKPKRIAPRIRQVVDLLVSGECKTQKAAARRVGLHPDYVSRELKKPHVRVFIDRATLQTIASGKMRASARLVQLIDATSEHVSADVSKHMLAIAGIKPANDAQLSVNIDIKAG